MTGKNNDDEDNKNQFRPKNKNAKTTKKQKKNEKRMRNYKVNE